MEDDHVLGLLIKVIFQAKIFSSFIKNLEALTIRDDKDKLFDKTKMHNQFPEDRHVYWDQCTQIELCDFPIKRIGKPAIHIKPNCNRFEWSGRCDIKF